MYFVQRLVFPTDFTLLSPYDSAGKVGQSSEPQHMEPFVEDIIGRYIGQEKDEQCERFLVENFAFRLSGLRNVGHQAHDVICDDELAPETILSETYLELEELLAVPERFSTIADWYLIRAKFIGIISQLSKP
ncbi:hypothetical protein DAPPUDRAFT_331066 [Daphnia pulex]|uniref:Uncharacterized protein n=1 Tax=Daphnia pulex TaxID=6669 RepID=E9HLE2_DAPPU|nr:hypothetical protein DAPPUDRAFT_331066 [Daphnia pulex]|eukprot:EFX67420.1 hypothetical protein DAPPUDRAFT_331066 [Daphnia pulex]